MSLEAIDTNLHAEEDLAALQYTLNSLSTVMYSRLKAIKDSITQPPASADNIETSRIDKIESRLDALDELINKMTSLLLSFQAK